MIKKKVAIIGAGRMVKPLVDYFIDNCKYEVVVADIDVKGPEKLIDGRPLGRAARWSVDEPETIDGIIREVDIVVSMVPKPIHIHVAKPCLMHGKNMVTTSYEIPEISALDQEAREKGVLILNEMGEDPGLDHLATQMILDEIKEDDGYVESLNTFGCSLPSFENNDNPLGYKFAWDPKAFFMAAQTPAAFYKNGVRIDVPGDKLFGHNWNVDIEGLGTFETYPNKDCKKYLRQFDLKEDISFYRGLLRYPGYCDTMNKLVELGMFDSSKQFSFAGMTYRALLDSIVNDTSNEDLEKSVANYLNIQDNNGFIQKLRWLGLFEEKEIPVKKGSRQDVLREIMLEKMSYLPHEKDRVILYIEAIADFPGRGREKRTATLHIEGIPYGDSAISRAVALPAAIATKLILEGEVDASGTHIPSTLPVLYKPVLKELANYGFVFKKRAYKLK